jgi:hypothetical protein
MSALGQKQTFAMQKAMSALHPIATSIAYLYDGGPLRLQPRWIFSTLGGLRIAEPALTPVSWHEVIFGNWAAIAYVGSPSFLGLYLLHGTA